MVNNKSHLNECPKTEFHLCFQNVQVNRISILISYYSHFDSPLDYNHSLYTPIWNIYQSYSTNPLPTLSMKTLYEIYLYLKYGFFTDCYKSSLLYSFETQINFTSLYLTNRIHKTKIQMILTYSTEKK